MTHKSTDFYPGQRWASDTEPELGLGIISDSDPRTITVDFPACKEVRTYSRAHAPLTRIMYQRGDMIKNTDDREFMITAVRELDNLIHYRTSSITPEGEPITVCEIQLNNVLKINKPIDRLFTGQLDSHLWFNLRQQTLQKLQDIESSEILGLCSGRTELISHQIYIANEVSRRYAPRVLLADEVGLGKTIEAGMILQQQLTSGLASRVLIIVPETLIHQWLVEMLRRFNLHFSIFDESAFQALQSSPTDNPFFQQQLALTSIEFFQQHPQWQEHAIAGEWDLCIIDEAHHLTSDTDEHDIASKGSDYQLVYQLSEASKGLLLLTATPEQLGNRRFYSLLHLLDKNRFSSYESFHKEQQEYQQIANVINLLLRDSTALPESEYPALERILQTHHSRESIDELLHPLFGKKIKNQAVNNSARIIARDKLIDVLLDQHGTGRILFRNTRRNLSGFPPRKFTSYSLELPRQYLSLFVEMKQHSLNQDALLQARLLPETAWRSNAEDNSADWVTFDPRVQWLTQFLQHKSVKKILLICHDDRTAAELEKFLRVNSGVRSALFNKGMSILERDRAAAYFATADKGAKILVCSEIGSEGRNFQFCSNLVLFDLPMNPDLLEQRIGRLDRIGQSNEIHIHIPHFEHHAQEKIILWYHRALDAFEKVSPAAFATYDQQRDRLLTLLLDDTENDQMYREFINNCADLRKALEKQLESGRDRLLEINSHRKEVAAETILRIEEFEANTSPESYVTHALDCFGVHYEHNFDGTYSIEPAEDMLVSHYPGLSESGLKASFDRIDSLQREDVQFLNWQHPLVRGTIELILSEAAGRAVVNCINFHTAPAGKLSDSTARSAFIVEFSFIVRTRAARELQVQRFLPTTPISVRLDSRADKLTDTVWDLFSSGTDDPVFLPLEKPFALSLLKEHRENLLDIIERGEVAAEQVMLTSVNRANRKMLDTLTLEIKRLVALKHVNPNVRESEIDYLKDQVRQLHECLLNASLELDAIHVIFNSSDH